MSGCNLIETSPVYGDAAAQSLIGELLSEMIEDQKLERQVRALVFAVVLCCLLSGTWWGTRSCI